MSGHTLQVVMGDVRLAWKQEIATSVLRAASFTLQVLLGSLCAFLCVACKLRLNVRHFRQLKAAVERVCALE